MIELFVDEFQNEFLDVVTLQTLYNIHREAAGDELAGVGRVDSAGAEIEDLLVTDLGGGAAVRAFHLVGVDF